MTRGETGNYFFLALPLPFIKVNLVEQERGKFTNTRLSSIVQAK